ncbi:hypothetical protein VPH35_055972 [Triticum aestivum]
MLGVEKHGRMSRTGMGKEQPGRSSGVARVMVEWSRPSLWASARRSLFPNLSCSSLASPSSSPDHASILDHIIMLYHICCLVLTCACACIGIDLDRDIAYLYIEGVRMI